ncbi:MAG: PorV/PorQ family protein [Fidelibacterota bacterium]
MRQGRIIAIVLMSMLMGQYRPIPSVVTKVGTASENWLKLETGTRAIGMGGAYVAFGTGVSSVPYNPAGVGYVNGMELYVSRTNYLAGITHNVISFGTRLSGSNFLGFHLFYLDSGPMDVTTEAYADGTGEKFSMRSFSFRTTYARRMTDRLKLGITLNVIHNTIYTVRTRGVAVDIGSNFDTGLYGFILGMSVTNFGPEVQYHGEGLTEVVPDTIDPDGQLLKVTESFPLPLSFRIGIANDLVGKESVFVKSDVHRLSVALDGINPIDYVMYGSMGLEYSYREFAFIRWGTHLNHDTMGMSAGAGVTVDLGGWALTVDYAFVGNATIEPTHQFGLNFQF